MINKTIFSILLLSFLLLFVTSISAYTIKIPVCTSSSTINDTCLNYSYVGAITNAPKAIMYLGDDGNLYLTNDTQVQYTIVNNYTNYTNVYNVTNVTQLVSNYYSYNLTNGSNITIFQNFTANDSIIRTWISSLNLSIFNNTIYNKSDADSIFAFKGDLVNLQNALANYATKNDISILDSKITQSSLSSLNLSGINGSINLKAIQDHIDNSTGDFSMTWKVIIIINCVLIVILILLIAKNMIAGE